MDKNSILADFIEEADCIQEWVQSGKVSDAEAEDALKEAEARMQFRLKLLEADRLRGWRLID